MDFIRPLPTAQGAEGTPSIGNTDSTFESALNFTLSQEGGISRDRRDPGNQGGHTTAYGITQQTYDSWRKDEGLVRQPTEKISQRELREIYYNRYYLPVKADTLPRDLAISLFDTAVNTGPSKAIRLLQRSLRIPQDGLLGPKTREALSKKSVQQNVSSFLETRRQFYRGLGKKEKYAPFLKGWLHRVDALGEFLRIR